MKRILLWTGGILAGFVVVVILAFRLSPWPSVAIIDYMFAQNDTASEQALARHVPPGVGSRIDLAYGDAAAERLDVFRLESATAPQPAIVWVHGGAWIAGSKEGISNFLRVLAGEGYTTVAVEYGTGYGTAYPVPVEQVNDAGWLAAHAAELGIDPARLVLAGDSAGAQLAAQVANLTTDPAYAHQLGIAPRLGAGDIKGVMLLSGAYDLQGIKLDGPYGWFIGTVLWAYSGVRDFMSDARFRLASVAEYVTAAFPPAYISSGNGDPLAPQALRLASRLRELGVDTDTLFFPDDLTPPLPHEYQFNLDRTEGAQSLEAMLAFLQKVVR